MNSRRSFVKKMALSSVVALSLSEIDIMAKPDIKDDNKISGDGFTFLFQGDSITDGNRGRSKDPNHIMGHGYAFSIASRVGADMPEKRLTFINRGISGNTVVDLEARWQKDTLDLKPDVLSVLVGINDASSVVFSYDNGVDIQKFSRVYDDLLTKTKEAFPSIVIVLGLPFILPVGKVKDNWDAYSADLDKRKMVVRQLAQKFDAVLVDFQKVFDSACKRAPANYWIWDGVHPTVAGHELMARQWLNDVSERLPFLATSK